MGRAVRRIAALVAFALAWPAPVASARTGPEVQAVVVWQHRAPGGDWNIAYSAVTGGAGGPLRWTAGDTRAAGFVTLAAGDDVNPQVAVLGTEAHAVWEHREPDGTSWIGWSRLRSGAWDAPARISVGRDAHDPAVAVDSDGRALAVWIRGPADGAGVGWSVWDGASWSAPGVVQTEGGAPSLPEIAFLAGPAGASATTSRRALLAYVDRIADGPARVYAAVWDGTGFGSGSPVPLAADQAAQMPSVASAGYGSATSAFSRIAVVPESSGGAHVYWGGPAAEPLARRYESVGVMGARLDPAQGWTALRQPNGSPRLGSTGCHSPAATMTGAGDVALLYGSFGGYEYTRRVRGSYTGDGTAYTSELDDVRPALASLPDGVLGVATGLGWQPGAASRITWSMGTLRPSFGPNLARITWSAPQTIDLPGESRYPEVASAMGGTRSPLGVVKGGRAYAAAGGGTTVADTGERIDGSDGRESAPAAEVPLPGSGAAVTDTSVERSGDTALASSALAYVVLPSQPPIVVRGLRVGAAAGCSTGPTGWTTIASLRIGDDPPIELDARTNMSVPLGAGTLHVNEQTRTLHGVAVRGLRLTGPGTDLTFGYAAAEVSGCVGTAPAAGGEDPHPH